jgi:hypothetical protein
MSDDDAEDEDSTDPVEDAAEILDLELQHRQWLRAAVPVLQARSAKSDPSDRVQFALDLAAIAICERIARICHSDLPARN